MLKNYDMPPLTQLFSSKEWSDLFNKLSETINFELRVYSSDGSMLSSTKENPLCNFIRSSQMENFKCPSSCLEPISKSSEGDWPVVLKCAAGATVFTFPLERHGEKIYVTGRGGFASYEDLLEFLRVAKTNNLPALPSTMPLRFTGADYAAAVARYVQIALNRLLNSSDETQRIEEKFFRMTSLFDSNTFGTLSRNTELLFRYILDTIEFIFGPAPSVLMALNRKTLAYESAYSAGRHREGISNFRLEANSPILGEMYHTRTFVHSQSMKAPASEGLLPVQSEIPPEPDSGKEAGPFYLFPIFIEGRIETIIGIFDLQLTREDIKIMNAFTDYLHLNFENRDLRGNVSRLKKADERFAAFVDFSNSITSALSREKLFHVLVEKSLHLLDAEQGSLMLWDRDTSELVVEAKKSTDDTVQEMMRLKKEESIAGMVLDGGEDLLVSDIENDPRIGRENRRRYRTKSFMCILLKIDGGVTGVLNISDKAQGDVFTEEDLGTIQAFVNSAALAIERSLLYKQTEELRQLSITDPLTGIYNRRYLNHRLSEEITRYNRYKHPFSFMMMDLDKFKEYNDTFGHISGDKLIKALAVIMEKSLRNVDIAARFGGDEFVAIFPQTAKDDAVQITNRLKDKIEKAFRQESFEMPLTISMGLTTFPDDAASVGELLEKTDQALYLAKKSGGNKVVYL